MNDQSKKKDFDKMKDKIQNNKDILSDDVYNQLKSFITQKRKESQHNGDFNNKQKEDTPQKPVKKRNFKHQAQKKIQQEYVQKKEQKQNQQQIRNVQKTNQSTKNPRHHKPSQSLEPRDAHHFMLKPAKSNPRVFPYLTPQQSFMKHRPYPKEIHKKKADKGVLRIIPFGGLEQVGINCIGFEYNNEVIIVDMGIQFPDEHMHGVQGKIPDISYLKGKKVIAVLITHGHIDHIGGVPYLMRVLGAHTPMYATPMAAELIKARQKDFKMPLNIKEFHRNKIYEIGKNFYAEPFTVDHSIPDSVGIRIHTPVGKFVHTGDWKFDPDPKSGVPSADHEQLKRFGKEGVRALLSDSTNAHLPGSALTEKVVIEPIEAIFEKAKGRIFTGTFSSIIGRVQIIIETAEKFNRKVVLLGRGMNTYFEIAKKLGYIKNKPETLISIEEAEKLPDNQVCVCCTGAQGERYAALMRIATGESQDTEFKDGDTVILSSSVIPGNERRVQELMDLLHEQNVLIHHYRQSSVHAGGHAREEDVKLMIEETAPEYFIPIYGNRFMIHSNADIARSMGYSDDKIFTARNGQIMEFTKDGKGKLTNLFAPHKTVTIDGYTVGFSNEKEFLERYQMSQSGILIINITEQKGKPRIHLIGHGFANLGLVPDIQNEMKDIATEIYIKGKKEKQNRDDVNRSIRKKIQSFIWNKMGKEPVVVVAS